MGEAWYSAVMYVAEIPNRSSPPTFLLRESFRQDGKVKNRTVANISHLPRYQIDLIRRVLRGETLVPSEGLFHIVRTFPHGHVAAVLGTLRKLGLDRLISSEPGPDLNVVIAMITARVLYPASKLATARGMNQETLATSLGVLLKLDDVTEDDLYAAMDWLLEEKPRIERELARRHLGEGTLVLCDVTSTYYTGTHCPLAEFGHSRDGKKGFPQIVFGLLCNREGCPVAVEVFKGNTADPMTLGPQIDKLRNDFGLVRLIVVGDRGLLTEARIRKDLAIHEQLSWITTLRAPAIRKLVQQGVVQRSLFDDQELAEVTSPDYPGERLVACRNPFLAEERTRKREKLLRATERLLDEIVAATQRERRPLRGTAKIGTRLGKVINRYKMGKHFVFSIQENSFSYERNGAKIMEEAALDGLYIVRTKVSAEEMSGVDTVRAYKGLASVEQAFRSIKTVDLKVRPIFHRLTRRVECHIFLCMLAYYVEWHMKQLLAPILFEEEDREGEAARRASIVLPAVRSAKAEAKARTKRTEAGEPVHSFRTLLLDLATLSRNFVCVGSDQEPRTGTFVQWTDASPLQERAFALLGVPYRM
jgi:transposase